VTGSVYATVPMPSAVAKLPRVGNMPVPWITEYEVDGQDPKWNNMRAPGGPVLGCNCTHGVGKAIIGKQCPIRQRLGMVHRRCNVCGRHIDGAAIFVGISASATTSDSALVPISMETPTHPRCAAYSALVCPAIGNDHATRCALGIVTGDYPMIDRWVAPDLLKPGELTNQYMAHNTPRVVAGLPVGMLDFVLARLDTPGTRFLTLAEWMVTDAPKPYRRLWRERLEVAA
jgi:hypothetical protein